MTHATYITHSLQRRKQVSDYVS